MAKKLGVRYVSRDLFEKAITEEGFSWLEQSGYLKVSGPKGHRIYVSRQKNVSRVDISGFEHGAGVVPHCGSFGNVHQQLDMSDQLTEVQILDSFRDLLRHMKTLEPKADVKPGKRAAKSVEEKPASSPAEDEAKAQDEEKSKRLARAIAIHNQRRGVEQVGAQAEEVEVPSEEPAQS